MLKNSMRAASAAALLCGLSVAHAHVTFEQAAAPAGSNYKAVLRVPHGCSGSPTRSITLFLPHDMIAAKPMPKAGWQLSIKNEKLSSPIQGGHGESITERVSEVTWSGARLLDSEYDEFVVRIPLPNTAGKRAIRVLQQCEKGENDWAAIAIPGEPRPAYPAPTLDIQPAANN